MIKINEIYLSVQGESTHTGLHCIFIRLTGCNLRCSWCDTAYAFYEGKNMSIDEQAHQIKMVKKYERVVIKDPITADPTMIVKEIYDITKKYDWNNLCS